MERRRGEDNERWIRKEEEKRRKKKTHKEKSICVWISAINYANITVCNYIFLLQRKERNKKDGKH